MTTVCLAADTIGYPEGGGHVWAYLNWALGLEEAGCEVLWLEQDRAELAASLRERLRPYGLDDSVVLWSEAARAQEEADLLLNVYYALPEEIVTGFRRSALLDIDPGLTQYWIASGAVRPANHDVRFTIGEAATDDGWVFTPPCVSLAAWPVARAADGAAFTTVSHWVANEWVEEPDGNLYANDKRTGFLPYLELPHLTEQPLELALCLSATDEDEEDRQLLVDHGWRVRDSVAVASTPWDYRRYVQASLGEWSPAKPSCRRQQNGWISDRTLCYLASGKPAVVEHSGPSRLLPDDAGVWRFRTPAEAARCLERIADDYERQCRLARALAEELFDAQQVATRLLERALA